MPTVPVLKENLKDLQALEVTNHLEKSLDFFDLKIISGKKQNYLKVIYYCHYEKQDKKPSINLTV